MITTVSAILADDLDTFRTDGPSTYGGPMELLYCWEKIKDTSHPTLLMSHLPYEYLPKDVKNKKIKVFKEHKSIKLIDTYMQIMKPLCKKIYVT